MASRPALKDESKQVAKVHVGAGGKLAAFVPQTMEEAWRLAGALAASGMTPKAYGADQNKIMVGIMAGAEVGLTPFAALQSIAVIGNNPSLWGDGALALVQASGLLEDMEEADNGTEATCRLNRAGRATPIVRKFNMDDAAKAGLKGKAGPWTQYPARMRQMRARAFALRDGFSDVLKGLHIAEEARDYISSGHTELIGAAPLTGAMLIDQAKEQVIDGETGEISNRPGAADAIPPAHQSEGRTDAEHGDQHDGTDSQDVELIMARIEGSRTPKDLGNVETEYLNIAARLSDEVKADIETALADRRLALRGSV